jgi:hypothetical protein
MTKPKMKARESFDYHECADYIEAKLGYDLRDTLGKFDPKNSSNYENIEYRDFWHFICDHCEIHNGCEFYMPEPNSEDYKYAKDWQDEILIAFWDEFGEGPYYVSW